MRNRNRQYYDTTAIFSAKGATGVSGVINCSDFRHAIFSLGTASSANMTIKIVGGIGDTPPDFSAVASATNRYQTIDFAPTNGAGVITDGDTGVSFAGSDGNEMLSAKVDGLDWIALKITAYSAGTVTADLSLYED